MKNAIETAAKKPKKQLVETKFTATNLPVDTYLSVISEAKRNGRSISRELLFLIGEALLAREKAAEADLMN